MPGNERAITGSKFLCLLPGQTEAALTGKGASGLFIWNKDHRQRCLRGEAVTGTLSLDAPTLGDFAQIDPC